MDAQQLRVTQAALDDEDDAGAWADAPATAATTVAMVNTSGRRVAVYVATNGATIASIKVDNVTTGLIVGTFVLRPGSSLTLAYTVATPALKWIYC